MAAVARDIADPGCGRDEPLIATILVNRRLDEIRSGSGVYLLGLLEYLAAAGYEIRILATPVAGFGSLPFSRPAKVFRTSGYLLLWPGAVRIGSVFISTSPAVWRRAALRGLSLLRWVLAGRRNPRPSFSSSLGRTPTDAEADRLIAVVNRAASTMVVAEYSSLGPLLKRCRAKLRAVLLHDLFALRTTSFLEAGLPPDHETMSLRAEIEYLRSADLCLYASAAEAERIALLLPDSSHIWLRPKVHLRPIMTRCKPHAVFLGVRHGGNQDALEVLLTEIWPPVRRTMPDAELWIVGEIAECVRGRHDGIRLIGRVDDITALGGSDAVGLAPARAASGISIKLATYLELGMSCIASPKALEGYGGALDDLVIRADDAREFSERLIALLRDDRLREEVARQGLEKLEARLGNEEFLKYLHGFTSAARQEGPRRE